METGVVVILGADSRASSLISNLSKVRTSLMKRCCCLLSLFVLAMTAGCGSGYNNPPTNIGLFGNWNVAMYPTGSTTAVYVFALAMSQEGSSNYSGASIAYTGSVPVPSNMCINAKTLSATATTSGSNFTMTVTDTSSNTIISVQGTLPTQTSSISGTYNNAASQACSASSGTMTMVAQ
jgi:hypothetical protein